jgi:hypothetical protein
MLRDFDAITFRTSYLRLGGGCWAVTLEKLKARIY